ncbi:hypothetical protein D3C81_826520 [compost metagenome]
MDRHHACRRQRAAEQHHGQARIAEDGQHRANQHVERGIASQRAEQHLHAGGLHHGARGDRDQFQREGDQPEPDQHPAHMPGPAALPAQVENHADEDQQRREPRQVHREHLHHQRRADVGAEHDGERGRHGNQALAHERTDDDGGGVAALHKPGHAEPGREGREAVRHADRQHMAQIGAIHAQDADLDDVGAPDQERHAR